MSESKLYSVINGGRNVFWQNEEVNDQNDENILKVEELKVEKDPSPQNRFLPALESPGDNMKVFELKQNSTKKRKRLV